MSNGRILVVEDDRLIRMILAESLSEEGYEVADASDGEAAVSLLDAPARFDVVITDIQMPGSLDGIMVGRHVQRRYPGTPIIYVTGRPESLVGVDMGPRDMFVRKPYGPFDILRLVQALIGPVAA